MIIILGWLSIQPIPVVLVKHPANADSLQKVKHPANSDCLQ